MPSRVTLSNIWDPSTSSSSSSSWSFALPVTRMGEVGGPYVAAALVPGLVIAVLFYFDHVVSAQLAQQEEFGLQKPFAYHWDLALLGERKSVCECVCV